MARQLGPQRGLDHPARELRQKPARARDLLRLQALERILQRPGGQQLGQTIGLPRGEHLPNRLVLLRGQGVSSPGPPPRSLAPPPSGRRGSRPARQTAVSVTPTSHRTSDRPNPSRLGEPRGDALDACWSLRPRAGTSRSGAISCRCQRIRLCSRVRSATRSSRWSPSNRTGVPGRRAGQPAGPARAMLPGRPRAHRSRRTYRASRAAPDAGHHLGRHPDDLLAGAQQEPLPARASHAGSPPAPSPARPPARPRERRQMPLRCRRQGLIATSRPRSSAARSCARSCACRRRSRPARSFT